MTRMPEISLLRKIFGAPTNSCPPGLEPPARWPPFTPCSPPFSKFPGRSFRYLPLPDAACSLSLIFHPRSLSRCFPKQRPLFPEEPPMPDVKLIAALLNFIIYE